MRNKILIFSVVLVTMAAITCLAFADIEFAGCLAIIILAVTGYVSYENWKMDQERNKWY